MHTVSPPGDQMLPTLTDAAARPASDVATALGSSVDGLSSDEAGRRLATYGPNILAGHGATAWQVLRNQLRNPLLFLLLLAATVSGGTGQTTDAAIIVVMVALSVGLGFVNEYRSEKAVQQLRDQVHHTAIALRDGHPRTVDVTLLVPGDVVRLSVGDVVPADVRLLSVDGFLTDEAVLTGESLPAEKRTDPVTSPTSPIDLASCAFMGTVVKNGTASALVVSTGSGTAFGKIAVQLGTRHAETSFQRGLRDFSKLLVRITAVLVAGIFLINLAIGRPPIDAVLFSLAVAVGLTPELLPAIVTISLSTGAKRMARKSVLVRRLVAIEDFGNIQVLFTDKTGTLTEGRISFRASFRSDGEADERTRMLGLICSDVVMEGGVPTGGSPLDEALWGAPDGPDVKGWTRVDEAAFDYDRRRMSVLVDGPDGRRLMIVKGAPESILQVCAEPVADVRTLLDREFDAGSRLVAVATREGAGMQTIDPSDEHDLSLEGFLAFVDPPKADAAEALERLTSLGVAVKIVTGDNERVARKVCTDLHVPVGKVLTGSHIDGMPDEELVAAIDPTTIFARVTPDQKSRVIRLARTRGLDVGYMGDGVNDAVALHDADVGISVDTATDVAKDAADILLLKKDLGTLADGVVEGRRIFANTIKYVLMATSSNFGNMFSAAAASAFLKFLPMLPGQILLNNLLYDTSQTTIPTDRVDQEQLLRPSKWDTRFIRRFMIVFGPISSLFDFATFAVMLRVFHAGESLFQTGWFVESLATQTLVIFVIRTRRVPFFRSRPSTTQLAMTLSCAAIGVVIPFVPPVADALGFTAPPLSFLAIVAGFIVAYLALAEFGKWWFYRTMRTGAIRVAAPTPVERRHVQRLASRWAQRAGAAQPVSSSTGPLASS